MSIRSASTLGIVAGALLVIALPARAEEVPGEVIVSMKTSEHMPFSSTYLPHVEGIRHIRPFPYNQSVLYVRTEPGLEQQVIEQLQNNPRVRAVQPNFVYRALFTPNDPSYTYQWNFVKVNAPTAWDFDGTPPLYGGDSSIVVAVLDTGVSYEDFGSFKKAPDFSGTTFVAGTDIVNNDSHPNDDHGHGTHVAATIGQTTNNALSGAGLAFASSIMPVKVLDTTGFGSTAGIASGVDFARQNGAKIINLSLGGTSDDPVLHTAIQNAVNAGIIVVAAAGNDAVNSLYFPARYDEAIAVGATRFDNTLAPYSNYGTGIDLVAPGGDLDVDQNSDGQPDGVLQQTCTSTACSAFGDYYFEGTSQATPHVSSAAALLLAAGVQSANVRTILQSSTRDLGASGYDTTYGYGLLDINAALALGVNDKDAPTGSVAINGGALNTNATTLTLTLSATDATSSVVHMSFSNDGATFSDWESYATSKTGWKLTEYGGSASEGTRTVYARFKDAAGNISTSVSSSIVYDATSPTRPVVSVHAPAPYANVALSSGTSTTLKSFIAVWDESTDALSGLAGYRIALSPNDTVDLSAGELTTVRQYESPATTTGRTLYLHVAAVDLAGNISTTTLTYVYQPLRIVTAAASGSGQLTLLTTNGKVAKRLSPFGSTFSKGLLAFPIAYRAAQPEDLIVAGQGRNEIKIINDEGKTLFRFKPYGSVRINGITVATLDLDNDGISEIVTAAQRGTFPVRIFKTNGSQVRSFWPFGKTYNGGVAVAVGDLDGTGEPRIIATRLSGSPLIRTFDTRGKRIRQIRGFSKRSQFGLALATGDVNGDGKDEIIVAPEEGPSQLRIFTGNGKLVKQFFTFGKKFRGGLRLATGDIDGDGKDEIVAIPARGAAQVRIVDHKGKKQTTFFAMPKRFRGGANLATLR